MTSIIIEVQGVERTVATFSRIADGLTRLRPLMERFGAEFYREETSLFERAPWAPLSEAYAEQKRKKFGSKPLLVATGTLKRSLTEGPIEGATFVATREGSIYRVRDDGAEFGSSIPYGVFHHEGRGRLPERPLLAEPDEERYATIASEYLQGILAKAA